MCQVAVTLTCASPAGARPVLLQHAADRGIRAGFTVGDQVYGGLDLRKSIRERGTGYVMAVRSNYRLTLPSGRHLTVKDASLLVKPGMWQRMRPRRTASRSRCPPPATHRYTGTVSSYLCWTPHPVPLAKLIKVAVTRWKIEDDRAARRLTSGTRTGCCV